MKLTIHKANQAFVIELPEEMVARLGWGAGDVLAAEVVGGALKLVRSEADVDGTMQTAQEIMDEYSWTLEHLAKT
jgi:hypothetical protein